jgi:hypothetical protein
MGDQFVPVPARSVSDRDRRTLARFRKRLPGFLHRYTGITGRRAEWLEDVLLRSRLYFPRYAQLNDPFEGSIPFTFEGSENEIRAYWEDVVSEMGLVGDPAAQTRIDRLVAEAKDPANESRLTARVAEELSTYGVACFAESDTDIPMWSYYADGHRGVCLRFRSQPLYIPKWEGCMPPVPVKYKRNYPKLSFYRDSAFNRMLALIATKSHVWRHEREWRIVRRGGPGSVQFNPVALDAVILGCKMPEEDKTRVEDMLRRRKPEARLLRIRREARSYGLRVSE